jgi:aspartyl-tRNA(Asn)/glutamyl-tRNA(Gln) amidotransferase subunit A
MKEEVFRLSALELRALYREGELSPVEVVEAVLERIDQLNPALNAFVTLTPELAREQAKVAENAYRRGDTDAQALLGVPFSIKDTIVTKGILTTMGSRVLSDWVPEIDAPSVERCREAGGAILGKTNAPEFGWKGETTNALFGTSYNPWSLELTPGGSSGGAAAAVASGLGPLALGTDAGGSIRIPAAFCGVLGLKPSFGLIPVAPGGGIETLPHIGILARTVRDAALLLEVLAGPDPRDRLSLPPVNASYLGAAEEDVRGLRVAWSPDLGFAPVEPEVLKLTADAANAFQELGCDVEEITPSLSDPFEIVNVLLAAGTAGAHRDNFAAVRTQLDPSRVPFVEEGFRLSAADVGAALAQRAQWADRMRVVLAPYDLLLTPAMPMTAFRAGLDGPGVVAGQERPGGLSWSPFTYPFNLTGQPAASVPCGLSAARLPVGLQIVGRWRDDQGVIRAAAAFEAARPWRDFWPQP